VRGAAVKRTIRLITDQRCLAHDTGGGDHPEVPQRLTAIRRRLEESRLNVEPDPVPLERAKWEWLLAAHEDSYLYRFEEAALSGKSYVDHPDNTICFDSYEAALVAASAGPRGVDLIEADPSCLPFCSVRPPGHHAQAARALGFCFVNNAVVAVRYWQNVHGRRRILVLDFDAHHGNGIQDAFERDRDVCYVSLHEHPTFSFPGTGFAGETGTGEGAGTVINCPLSPGSGDGAALAALRETAAPAAERFRPEALVVSAGFDGHREDDMSGLAYSTDLFGEIGLTVGRWARQWCSGRVLSILEGGYHLEALALGVEAYLEGLAAGEEGGENDVR